MDLFFPPLDTFAPGRKKKVPPKPCFPHAGNAFRFKLLFWPLECINTPKCLFFFSFYLSWMRLVFFLFFFFQPVNACVYGHIGQYRGAFTGWKETKSQMLVKVDFFFFFPQASVEEALAFLTNLMLQNRNWVKGWQQWQMVLHVQTEFQHLCCFL